MKAVCENFRKNDTGYTQMSRETRACCPQWVMWK